jgi:hypothetical protein
VSARRHPREVRHVAGDQGAACPDSATSMNALKDRPFNPRFEGRASGNQGSVSSSQLPVTSPASYQTAAACATLRRARDTHDLSIEIARLIRLSSFCAPPKPNSHAPRSLTAIGGLPTPPGGFVTCRRCRARCRPGCGSRRRPGPVLELSSLASLQRVRSPGVTSTSLRSPAPARVAPELEADVSAA